MNTNIWKTIRCVREQSPLVHNITNYVVMNNTANALLAAGASPIMAHAPEEMPDMVCIVGALVLNIGTLERNWVDSMKLAAKEAAKLKKPIVLDPVGAGATAFRNQAIEELLEAAPLAVIRGNASEIMAVAGISAATKGVDSVNTVDDAYLAAIDLHERTGAIVCVSGKKDMVVANGRIAYVDNGSALMPKVTGLGCTATALIGAFCAVEKDYFHATLSAMSLMGVAGELAEQHAKGPGTFQAAFLDALYNLSEQEFESRIKVEVHGSIRA